MFRTTITPQFGFQSSSSNIETAPPVNYYGNAANPYVRVMQPVAPGAYGIQNQGVQTYLPINGKRPLGANEEEDKAIQKGLKQWWSKPFPDYGTPMTRLLASPAKSGIIGTLIGVPLAGLGALMLFLSPNGEMQAARKTPAIVTTVLGSTLFGALAYFRRQQKNGNILDLLKRLPPGATKRDMMSDPVYQADLNRKAMANGGGGVLDTMGGMILADSLMGSRGSSRGRGSRRSRFE